MFFWEIPKWPGHLTISDPSPKTAMIWGHVASCLVWVGGAGWVLNCPTARWLGNAGFMAHKWRSVLGKSSKSWGIWKWIFQHAMFDYRLVVHPLLLYDLAGWSWGGHFENTLGISKMAHSDRWSLPLLAMHMHPVSFLAVVSDPISNSLVHMGVSKKNENCCPINRSFNDWKMMIKVLNYVCI